MTLRTVLCRRIYLLYSNRNSDIVKLVNLLSIRGLETVLGLVQRKGGAAPLREHHTSKRLLVAFMGEFIYS